MLSSRGPETYSTRPSDRQTKLSPPPSHPGCNRRDWKLSSRSRPGSPCPAHDSNNPAWQRAKPSASQRRSLSSRRDEKLWLWSTRGNLAARRDSTRPSYHRATPPSILWDSTETIPHRSCTATPCWSWESASIAARCTHVQYSCNTKTSFLRTSRSPNYYTRWHNQMARNF